MKGQKFNGAKPKAPVSASGTNSSGGFKTDSDISKAKFKERELQRWVPDENDVPKSLSLEDDGAGWDQFKVNETKFGVGSTYDEHLYTTRINTEAKDYQERLKKAEKLAREIENDVTSDPHIMEERGKIDDSGVDEEDKYSGVDRTEEVAKPKDTRGDELMAALKSVNLNDKKYLPPKARALGNNHNDPAIVSTESKRPDSIPSKPPQASNTQTSSKAQSPNNESFRLNAQSEINSLREFSATFKVPHRMPNDMVPMLSKKPNEETSNSQSPVPATAPAPAPAKKKMDPTKPAFKLNPKAASFTPSAKPPVASPKTQPKLSAPNSASTNGSGNSGTSGGHNYGHNHNFNHNRSPNNPSPRMNTQRPYSNNSSNSSNPMKRHYQISPTDFFGGSNKIPTKESQVEKSKKFKLSFNLFVTAKSKTEKDQPVIIERAFITPPTWDQTIDEPHQNLFPQPDPSRIPMSIMPSPFIQSQMMGSPSMGMYPSPQLQPPTPNQSKFSMSPLQGLPQIPPPTQGQRHSQGSQGGQGGSSTPQGQQPPTPQQQQQQAMAAQAAMFQQQQFQAAMMYQQQYGMMMPGQQPMPGMYMPNGSEGFMPPSGYMPPPMNYGSGSPTSSHMMMNNNYNGNHQNYGNRRYQKRNT